MESSTSADISMSAEQFEEPAQYKLAYSKSEAARLLSVSLRMVDYLIEGRELEVRRIGRRVLIPHRSLLQFIRRDHKTGRSKTRIN